MRIAGVETTQERQSLVEANFDALAATVSLKASLTEVRDEIAAAVLDPADLASLTELQARVTDVEIALDAAAGTLTLLSDTLTVEGGLVTMTEVTGRLDSAEGALALKVDQVEFDAAEARLSDAEIAIETLDGAGITFAVSDQRLLRDETLQSDDAAAEGLLRAWLDGQGARDAAASGRRELTAVVTEGLQAEAAERLTLTAQVAEAQAQILAESTVRASETGVLTGVVAAQETRLGTAESAITTINATKVDAAGAVAAVNQTISASYGSMTALAEASAFAESTLDGITSGFVWKLGGGDVLSLVQVDDGITEPVTTARIRGDFIKLDGTVEVTGDFLATKIFAEEILVERLTVTEELIAPNATGVISSTTLASNFAVAFTTYSTVLTLTANHANRPSDMNMIFNCRIAISSVKEEAASNSIQYRILRNGVLMSGVPPYRREVPALDISQEFFSVKQRTTANASATTYELQVRTVVPAGPGVSEPVIMAGTQMWTVEESIAGLV